MEAHALPVEPTGLPAAVARHTHLRRSGRHYRGLCVFHTERTPSLCVFPDTGTYHCFGCGAHGDLIQWLREVDGLPFPAARAAAVGVRTAIARQHPTPAPAVGPTVPGVPGSPATPTPLAFPRRSPPHSGRHGPPPSPLAFSRPEPPRSPPSPAWQARGESLLAYAADRLRSAAGAPARAWLAGPDRLLADDTIAAAGLGYVDHPLLDHPTRWGLEPLEPGDRLRIPRSILIPTRVDGQLWSIKCRPFDPATGRPSDSRPKYVAVRGSVPALLGADDLRPGHTAILTEGEFDRWICRQQMAGDDEFASCTPLTMGAATHRLTPFWLWRLSSCPRILTCHDNDTAGRLAAASYQNTPRLSSHFPPPRFNDLTDLARAGQLLPFLHSLVNPLEPDLKRIAVWQSLALRAAAADPSGDLIAVVNLLDHLGAELAATWSCGVYYGAVLHPPAGERALWLDLVLPRADAFRALDVELAP